MEISPQTTPLSNDPPIQGRKLFAIVNTEKSEDELLKHRFLCRYGTLQLVGPTGIGKSSLSLQCAILWALGRPACGIEPARPLRSLVIQAENDDGDLVEMREGVVKGLGLLPSDIEQIQEHVTVCNEAGYTGNEFIQKVVRPLLRANGPTDLLWIDPALSFMGGDANLQKDVGLFLRSRIQPVLREFHCGCVIIHHTNKSQGSNSSGAYAGSGSAEWGNFARATLWLQHYEGGNVFKLEATKRGSRLQWHNGIGETITAKFLRHGDGTICWHEATDVKEDGPGRPPTIDAGQIAALLRSGPLRSGDWEKIAIEQYDVSESTFQRHRRDLVASNRVKKEGDLYVLVGRERGGGSLQN